MTGAGCRTMTLNKPVFSGSVIGLLLIIAVAHNAHSATATASVKLKATFIAPPCTITTPDRVPLGMMLPGSRSYLPFSITISCLSATPTFLYAQIVQGSLSAGTTDRVDMNGPAGTTGTPAQLWLTDSDGKTVILDGSGASDNTKGFCTGTTDRTCRLTPSVQVAANTPKGLTTATVRFSVAYP